MKEPRISHILSFCIFFIFLIIPFLASAAVLKLAWDPSTEQNLAGYKIYYGYASGDYDTSIDVGNTTTFQITDLEYDQTYYFATTAYDTSGLESDYSNEISCTIPKSDSDRDDLTEEDEINIYGTDPNSPDTDKDAINDGDEVAFWGYNWDMDYDNDGIINLLDPDSDNDGFLDGLETIYGFDPSDPYSRPPSQSDGLFVCDAEEGDNSDFDGTFTQGLNTFTATESAKNNGNYGYAAGFDGSSDEVYAYKDFSDQSDVYARFYFKITNDFHLEGDWVKIPVFQLMDGGTSLVIFYLLEANSGEYGWSAELWNPYAPIAGEWRGLRANRWYMIEIRWKQDPLEGGAEIWIDDVPMGSVYTEDTSMQNANSIQVGRGYSGDGDPGVLVTSGAIYFDDVRVDTSHK
ncbi:MAG: hypothetical protein LWX01_00710 [Deltaproteobacteria bacterium]|nr:hypothetical protein [Deltaproteobacteria bacterium]MDL1960222.1 hypothetical protein [Deltaproteobacteria bacterium]